MKLILQRRSSLLWCVLGSILLSSTAFSADQSFWSRLFNSNRNQNRARAEQMQAARDREAQRQRELQRQMALMQAQQAAIMRQQQAYVTDARQASYSISTMPARRTETVITSRPEPSPTVVVLQTPYGTRYNSAYGMMQGTQVTYDSAYRRSSYSPSSAYSNSGSQPMRQVMSISTQNPASVSMYGGQVITNGSYQEDMTGMSPYGRPLQRAADVGDYMPQNKPANWKRITHNPFDEPSAAATASAQARGTESAQLSVTRDEATGTVFAPVKGTTLSTGASTAPARSDKGESFEPARSDASITGDIPVAFPLREGRVSMPFPPYTVLNVEGMASGSIAMDPTSERKFRVP